MKKIAAILVLVLLILPLSALAFDMPDYKNEAELVSRVLCDQNTSKGEEYQTSKYFVLVVTVKSGNIFYMYHDAEGERLFLQLANSKNLTELTHEKWDETLAQEAPNAYNQLHGGPSDCVKSS